MANKGHFSVKLCGHIYARHFHPSLIRRDVGLSLTRKDWTKIKLFYVVKQSSLSQRFATNFIVLYPSQCVFIGNERVCIYVISLFI
jgi:hypothetical protein